MIETLKQYFNVGSPDWTIRRRIVIYTLLFCAGMTVYVATSGTIRIELATAIVSQSFTLCTVIITGYVIAAVADDHLNRQDQKKQDPPNV